MLKKIIVSISIVIVLAISLVLFYEKDDSVYISKANENNNITMIKIVGDSSEVISQVPETGSWDMTYDCDDESAKLFWNEKERKIFAKNLSSTECTVIFRESNAVFRLISMYVDGEYIEKLDENKTYMMESYNCTNGETVSWDAQSNRLSIEPIYENTSCDVNFIENEYLTLTETMINDNKDETTGEVLADTEAAVTFSVTSSETNVQGLYKTEDLTKTEGGVTVYYYRGEVENNYVLFGGFCWRIVRTVEDGSVRLRYGGVPTEGVCPQTGTAVNIGSTAYNTSYNDKSYVNYKTSTIKGVIEDWYKANIYYKSDGVTENTALTSLIADTPYCNDMTEPTTNYFGAYDRLEANKSPQYKCSSDSYKYTVANGSLTYPIALLTADEVAYAVGTNDTNNSSYYLYTGENYCTMTPSYFSDSTARVFYVQSAGDLDSHNVADSCAAVPAISLTTSASVENGTGTYNDPYVIYTK